MSHAEALFQDRADAGRQLARRLAHFEAQDVVVLALPRGGVPVAAEIAEALGAPMDVFLVRKLGVPGQEELAMGAIAEDGFRYINSDIVHILGIGLETIESITLREEAELVRRADLYRGGRDPAPLDGKIAVLVDDGLATGASMRVAIKAVCSRPVERCVVAAPVGAIETCQLLATEADDLVCLFSPEPFQSVGQWYADFTQTTDAEVQELLMRHQTPAA